MSETAEIVGGEIIVTTAYRKTMESLGARRRGASWALPATRANCLAIGAKLPQLPPLSVALVATRTVSRPGFYEHQTRSASLLASAPHGALAWVPPGYGKTAIAVAAADDAYPDERVVVACPTSMTRTWEREIGRWSPGSEVYVIDSPRIDYERADAARWLVVSIDRATRIKPEEWGRGWPLWIIDESAMVKSRRSQRYRALERLRRRCVDRMWLLSGFPTPHHADDLWTQLHLLWPVAFPSYWRFAERYCVVEETPWARTVVETRADADVMGDNADLIIRVDEDALDIPEYVFDPVWVDLRGRQEREYRRMRDDFVAELADGTEVVAESEIGRLVRLQQIASWWDGESAKHDWLVSTIRDGVYEPPYLVWVHWKEGASAIHQRILYDTKTSCGLVTGDTPQRERDDIIEAYKRGDIDCLVLSLGVGKYGHTLTNTRTVFGLDRTFSADDYFQSMRRVRRIGLAHRPAMVPIIAAGTADEITVGDNLEQKLRAVQRMTRGQLGDLLRGIGR